MRALLDRFRRTSEVLDLTAPPVHGGFVDRWARASADRTEDDEPAGLLRRGADGPEPAPA